MLSEAFIYFFLWGGELNVCECIIPLSTIMSDFSRKEYEGEKELLSWVSSAERSALLVWSSILSQSECLLFGFLVSYLRLLSYSDQVNTCYWGVFPDPLNIFFLVKAVPTSSIYTLTMLVFIIQWFFFLQKSHSKQFSAVILAVKENT